MLMMCYLVKSVSLNGKLEKTFLPNTSRSTIVSVSFLAKAMVKMGFSCKWVALIMRCNSSSFFSLLTNGTVRGIIHPQRGVRRGCPLSPYLFFIYADVLSSLPYEAAERRLIHGVGFDYNHGTITHLFF